MFRPLSIWHLTQRAQNQLDLCTCTPGKPPSKRTFKVQEISFFSSNRSETAFLAWASWELDVHPSVKNKNRIYLFITPTHSVMFEDPRSRGVLNYWWENFFKECGPVNLIFYHVGPKTKRVIYPSCWNLTVKFEGPGYSCLELLMGNYLKSVWPCEHNFWPCRSKNKRGHLLIMLKPSCKVWRSRVQMLLSYW